MSFAIGGTGLPPIYPVPPASGSGEGDSDAPPSSGAAPGDGGPDAVYEPGAPEDGEPLTYSFPQGASSAGGSADEEQEPDAGEPGDPEESGVDPYAGQSTGEEPSYGDYGASGDEGVTDPDAGIPSGEDADAGHEDYGLEGEPESDPSSGHGAVDDSEIPVDPYAGDGSGDVTGDADDEGMVEEQLADAADNGSGHSDPDDVSDATGNAAIASQPVLTVAPDNISRAAQKDVAQKEAAAAEASRPSLASALGHSRQHVSLAAQIGTVSGTAPASEAVTQDSGYAPVRSGRTVQAAATGSLLSPAQDPAAALPPEAPKAKASVMAQAAYTMIGEAQRLDRSVLSLLKFG